MGVYFLIDFEPFESLIFFFSTLSFLTFISLPIFMRNFKKLKIIILKNNYNIIINGIIIY